MITLTNFAERLLPVESSSSLRGANGRRAPSSALGDNEEDELKASGEVSGVAGKEASGARRLGSTRCAGTGSIDWRLREALRVDGAATASL